MWLRAGDWGGRADSGVFVTQITRQSQVQVNTPTRGSAGSLHLHAIHVRKVINSCATGPTSGTECVRLLF